MKYLLVILLCCASLTLQSQSYKELKKEKPWGLFLSNDKFEQITWVKTGPMPMGTLIGNSNYGLKLHVYFGIYADGSTTSLRFKFKYNSSSWMFIETLTFLCGQGKKQLPPIKISMDRDTSPVRDVRYGGNILEVYDVTLNDELDKFVEYYINGGKFTSTKIGGKDSYLVMGTFGIKLNKRLPPIYEYYKKKSAKN